MSTIANAFKNLRAAGFIARRNHQCCGGCSGAKIVADVEAMPVEKRAKIRGAIHYNRQAGANFDNGGDLYIAYSPVEIDGVDYGIPSVQIGAELVAALRAEGETVEWSGDKNDCVIVLGERGRRDRLRAAAAFDSAAL